MMQFHLTLLDEADVLVQLLHILLLTAIVGDALSGTALALIDLQRVCLGLERLV